MSSLGPFLWAGCLSQTYRSCYTRSRTAHARLKIGSLGDWHPDAVTALKSHSRSLRCETWILKVLKIRHRGRTASALVLEEKKKKNLWALLAFKWRLYVPATLTFQHTFLTPTLCQSFESLRGNVVSDRFKWTLFWLAFRRTVVEIWMRMGTLFSVEIWQRRRLVVERNNRHRPTPLTA